MSAILRLLDTSAKRWLALLAGVLLLSVTMLLHSFMNAVSSQEQIVVAPPPAAAVRGPATVRTEPSWGGAQPVGSVEQGQVQVVVDRVSPFDNQKPPPVKRDPVVYQEMVHHQADYLRTLIVNGKLPARFGHLTKEQVDEMEKNGEMIN